MTVTEKDIYTSAKVFLEQHQGEAILKALEKMQEFEAKGDIEACECWNQIAGAIKWMSEHETTN